MQAETMNGVKDDDGCPDPGAELARLVRSGSTSTSAIGFVSRGGKLQIKEARRSSVNLVALIMKGHPRSRRSASRSTPRVPARPRRRSRADAVRDFLVSKGVDGARLTPVGAGAGTSRVDFIIDTAAAKPAAPAAPARRACPPLRRAAPPAAGPRGPAAPSPPPPAAPPAPLAPPAAPRPLRA